MTKNELLKVIMSALHRELTIINIGTAKFPDYIIKGQEEAANDILLLLNTDKWISVEERLPEPTRNLISEMVLTARQEAGVITNYYDHEYKTWTVAQDYIITHWMPLPNTPQS